MDFLVDDGSDESLEDRINVAVEQLAPEGYKSIGIGYGPKERKGPVHCFIEFYGEDIPEEDQVEILTDRMRLEGE